MDIAIFFVVAVPYVRGTNGSTEFAFDDQSVDISMMQKRIVPEMSRGRPREFDEDVVIERAMGIFWSRGYHGTSLPDLLEATRLSRGSLYSAFGDKHTLFLRALDRYVDDALTRLDAELDPRRGALAGVRACVDGYIERTSGSAGRRGCLVVATAMELSAHDPEVAQHIRRFFRGFETRLSGALARAKSEGHLREELDPAILARLLLCQFEGMRVVGKVGQDKIAQAAVRFLIDSFAK
jgi:TetR/AcrR family transcriptional repressor of nem operon